MQKISEALSRDLLNEMLPLEKLASTNIADGEGKSLHWGFYQLQALVFFKMPVSDEKTVSETFRQKILKRYSSVSNKCLIG